MLQNTRSWCMLLGRMMVVVSVGVVVVVVLLYGCQFLVFGKWVRVVGGQHDAFCRKIRVFEGGVEEWKLSVGGRENRKEREKERVQVFFFSVLILAGV